MNYEVKTNNISRRFKTLNGAIRHAEAMAKIYSKSFITIYSYSEDKKIKYSDTSAVIEIFSFFGEVKK